MRNVNEILGKYQQNVNFNFEERKREFISLKDFAKDLGTEHTYPIEAIFINTKSKFGDNGVIYCRNYMINLPVHLTKLCEDLRQDSEFVEAVNEGQVGFEVYQYEGKNGVGYSINLVPYQ